MANNEIYIERLRLVVERLNNCKAAYLRTVSVHEVFQGKTVWNGNVEVFDITGHPKTELAYGWIHKEGDKDEGERFVVVLRIPPVKDAKTAVQASIMADSKTQ